MPVANEIEEIVALALVFVVHVIGGLMLVWALLDDEARAAWRRHWGRGDDGGTPPGQPPPAPTPGNALPLADAGPSRARLREPGRAADAYPRPPRRRQHEPQPVREPGRA